MKSEFHVGVKSRARLRAERVQKTPNVVRKDAVTKAGREGDALYYGGLQLPV